MTQFSLKWILSLNWLCQKWGQVHIDASEFKARCLSILDHLESDGVVITKHGKPVAKLIPMRSSCADLIGSFKGKIRSKGNLLSTGLKWDAQS